MKVNDQATLFFLIFGIIGIIAATFFIVFIIKHYFYHEYNYFFAQLMQSLWLQVFAGSSVVALSTQISDMLYHR